MHFRPDRGDGIVSYYFTNFQPNLDREALWRLFTKWGKVADLFIPKKRNKEGKAFGFIRYQGVQYPQELERRLDQIWIGTFKLRANYIRYRRHETRKEMPVEVPRRKDAFIDGSRRVLKQKIQSKQHEATTVVGANMFAEVVKGKKRAKVWQRKMGSSDEWRGFDFTVKEDEFSWLGKCYVGYVHNPDAVYLLQDKIIDKGVLNFTVTPMGSEMVLIKPGEGRILRVF